MSPRKSVAETAATRARILDRAFALAVVDGLDAVTIGRLADDLGMSKAGVIGHFGTKEALQLAVIDEAVERFRLRVAAPVAGAAPGAVRLARALGEWIGYMAADGNGGCFLTSVATEFDGRPGAVRDRIRAAFAQWNAFVAGELDTAVATGELAPDTDIDQIAFELGGITLAADRAIQLWQDPQAPDRARRAVGRLLTPPTDRPASGPR